MINGPPTAAWQRAAAVVEHLRMRAKHIETAKRAGSTFHELHLDMEEQIPPGIFTRVSLGARMARCGRLSADTARNALPVRSFERLSNSRPSPAFLDFPKEAFPFGDYPAAQKVSLGIRGARI